MSGQDPQTLEASGSRDSSPDFAALHARASRRRLLIFGGVATLLLLGGGAALVSAQRAARNDLEATIAGLRACLLGGPLDRRETPSLRFRRLQLHALSRPEAERLASGNKLWPFSCREGAGRTLDLLKASATEADQQSLTALVALLSDGTAVSKDASTAIDAALPVLDAAFAAAIPKAPQPLPPTPNSVDSLADTVGLSKKGLSRSFTEDNPGLSLPVLIDEEDLPAPLFCTFLASREDADCRSLTELTQVHGHGLRLLGTSDPDAPNLVFAGKRGSEGVFVVGSATPIDRMYSYGGYSSRDGAVSVLGWDEAARGIVLTQKSGALSPIRTALKPNFRVGNFFYGSQLLWDQVLVRGITPDNERRLFVLPLAQKDKHSFELVDIGELPEPGLIRPGEEQQPHLTGCRSEKATVIRVRGDRSDFLTFRIGGAFGKPVEAPPSGVLGCYGTTATIVHVSHGSSGSTRLYHDTCTSAGCVRAVLNSEALDGSSSELRPREPSDVAAVDLEGKLLAVWLAGERGGLRMRIGEPEKFAHSKDVVVLDDRVSGHKTCRDSTILGFRLYSRERFAVLLLSTMAGVHAFRIAPDGAIKPWNLKLQK